MFTIDDLTDITPETPTATIIRRIKLTDGTEITNAFIEDRAPRIQGFIALAGKRRASRNSDYIVDCTRYINLNSIASFTIDNEVLERVSPSYFIPEQEIKIKR